MCCCWCFLPKGRFFLIDAKFLCHVPFLSALRNQSHSIHLLASMHPITLFLVFQEFSFLETFLRWLSVIRSCVLRHAQSNFSVFFSNFPSRSDFNPPFLISAHLMHAVSRESSSFIARSTSQKPLDFWYPLVSMSRFHYHMKPDQDFNHSFLQS